LTDADVPPQASGGRSVQLATAELALAQDAPIRALEFIDDLFASAPNVGKEKARQIPYLAKLRGDALVALGQLTEAESTFLVAQKGAQAQDLPPLVWRIRLALGNLYQMQGGEAEARRSFAAAREIIQTLADGIPDDLLRDEFLQGTSRRLPRKHSLIKRDAKAKSLGGLTPRQREVAWHVAQGKTNKVIAEELVLSVRTVEDHVSNILSQLDFDSRTEIAAWVVKVGLELD
jgi:DNA-binding CsgD family transcriptional regulator